jgi:hypothetical protein
MSDLTSNYEFLITLAVLLGAAAVIGYMSWLERRPRKSLTPRMIPTTPTIIVFGFIALLAVVHLANLYGIHTGRR